MSVRMLFANAVGIFVTSIVGRVINEVLLFNDQNHQKIAFNILSIED